MRSTSKPVELRYVLFQNVQTLSIFVPANLGETEKTVRREALPHAQCNSPLPGFG